MLASSAADPTKILSTSSVPSTDLKEAVTGFDAVIEALRNDLILIEIFGHTTSLDPTDLLNCRLVNLKWCQIASSLIRKLDLFQVNLVYDESLQEYTKVTTLTTPTLSNTSRDQCGQPACQKLVLHDLTILLNVTPNLFPVVSFVLDPIHLDRVSMQYFLTCHGHQIKDLTVTAWDITQFDHEQMSEMIDTCLRRLLFEGQCPNVESLCLEKIPKVSQKTLETSKTKNFLPKLKILHVESYEEENDYELDPPPTMDPNDLWNDLLVSAINVEKIDLGSTTLLPTVVRTGRSKWVKTVPFEPSEMDIEYFEALASHASLCLILAINFCGVCHEPLTLFPRAVDSLNKILAHSRLTLTSIMFCQPLNFVGNLAGNGGCGHPVEIPVCPNLRHFECFVSHVHEMTGATDFQMFPLGFCPQLNFPRLRDLQLNLTESGNRSTWDDYFPQMNDLQNQNNNSFILPNVLKLDGHFLLSQFPPEQLHHWSVMCPNLRILSIFSFNVDELAGGLANLWEKFPQIFILNVGVYVYKTHLVQSLQASSSSSSPNPNFSLAAAVDSAITGLTEQKCQELAATTNFREDICPKILIQRENRLSLLDMKQLKYLTFNFETDEDDDWDEIEESDLLETDEGGGHHQEGVGVGWKKVKIMTRVAGLFGFDQVPNLTVNVTAIKRHSGASAACKEYLKDCLVDLQKYMR